MENLYVCGRFELPHLNLGRFTHMISVQNSDLGVTEARPEHITSDKHLVLRFSDVTDPSHDDAPNTKELEKLFEWLADQERIESLLIHCSAGLRRSPAVALFCVEYLTKTPFPDSLKFVEKHSSNRYIWPNELVVNLCDKLRNCGKDAIKAVENWKESHTEPI